MWVWSIGRMILLEKANNFEENVFLGHSCPTIPHWLTWNQSLSSEVRDQLLTTLTVARSYILLVRIRCPRQGIQRYDTRVLFWYVVTNVSEDNSALTMEAVCSSEIITFTYHVTTRCNSPEALYVYRKFIGVDLVLSYRLRCVFSWKEASVLKH